VNQTNAKADHTMNTVVVVMYISPVFTRCHNILRYFRRISGT